MMCGDGGGEKGGKGAGEEDTSTMWIVASIDHCGRHHPMATTGSYPRQ